MTPLKRARTSKGITQVELAEKASIDQSHYSRIESGKEQASPAVAAKIAEVLGPDLIDELQILYPQRYAERKAANA